MVLISIFLRCMKCHLIIIGDTSKKRRHDTFKYIIRSLQNFFSRPIVHIKANEPTTIICLKSLTLIIKDIRSRHSESIDTLLNITHHEHVYSISLIISFSYRAKQSFLKITTILILIYVNEFIFLRLSLSYHRRRICLLIIQNIKSRMSYIIKCILFIFLLFS